MRMCSAIQALVMTMVTMSVSPNASANELSDAMTQFEVPTVKTSALDVSGQDLLRYGDDKDLRVNLSSGFTYLAQTPTHTLGVTNLLSFDFGGVPEERSHTLGNDLQLEYRRYLNSSRGVYVETLAGMDYDNSAGDNQDAAKVLAISYGVGAGYGRILDTRTVSQAAAMCELATTQCDSPKLLEIADILNKNNEGYYAAEYKLDGERYFYDELSKAVGTSDAFALNQVLTSPLYNITPKRVGFEVGVRLLGVQGDFLKEEDTDPDPDSDQLLQQYAGLASMLTPGTNVFIEQTLTHGAKQATGASEPLEDHPGEKNNVLAVEVGISVDHSYRWATQTSLQTNMLLPEEGDRTSNYAFSAQSDLAIGVKTVVGGHFMVGNGDSAVGLSEPFVDLGIGDAEVHWRAMLNFRHFIF